MKEAPYRLPQLGNITALKEINGIKSIPSPTAQTITLCQLRESLERPLNNLMYEITLNTMEYRAERMLCDLLLSGGLRVSEVLGSGFLKVNRLGQIYIRGLKGSGDKLVTPIFFANDFKQGLLTGVSIFEHISRFSFHKWLVKREIYINHSPGAKRSTTHTMRHLHVYLMELMALETTSISQILGHKSIKSIDYYLHGKR